MKTQALCFWVDGLIVGLVVGSGLVFIENKTPSSAGISPPFPTIFFTAH